MDLQKASFLERYFDWKDWFTKAHHLKSSADLLHLNILENIKNKKSNPHQRQYDLLSIIGPAQLLTGLSIENLLKSKIIHGFTWANSFPIKNEFEKDEKFLEEVSTIEQEFENFIKENKWNSRSGHGIYEMLKYSEINLTDTHLKYLKRIEVHLLWAGKYFFPKINKHKEFKHESNLLRYHPSDKDIFNDIFQIIKNNLPNHKVDFT